MKLIFTKEMITGAGVYRNMFQDEALFLKLDKQYGVEKDPTKPYYGRHYIYPATEETISDLLIMINAGVEVDEMPIVIKAPVSILQQEVYEGLPFRLKADQSVKLFSEWGDSQPLRLSNNGQECLLICTVNGRYLYGSEWSNFSGRLGLTILSGAQVQALTAEDPNWQVQPQ